MMRLITALALFCLALGANAALYFRDSGGALPSPEGDARVVLSGTVMMVPRAYLRDSALWSGGRTAQLDLAFAIEDFAPLPQPNPNAPFAPMPDRLMASISLAQNAQGGPADALQTLYARFLGSGTFAAQGGLVMRHFRSGTPYDDRALYIGAGSNRLFVALCPKTPAQTPEPCIAKLRQDMLDIELRFDAAYLPQWRRLNTETLRLLAAWRE